MLSLIALSFFGAALAPAQEPFQLVEMKKVATGVEAGQNGVTVRVRAPLATSIRIDEHRLVVEGGRATLMDREGRPTSKVYELGQEGEFNIPNIDLDLEGAAEVGVTADDGSKRTVEAAIVGNLAGKLAIFPGTSLTMVEGEPLYLSIVAFGGFDMLIYRDWGQRMDINLWRLRKVALQNEGNAFVGDAPLLLPEGLHRITVQGSNRLGRASAVVRVEVLPRKK